jgi:hypothetical protein
MLAAYAGSVCSDSRNVIYMGMTMDTPNQVIDQRREKLLRDYAAGKVSWSTLRRRGFDDYVAVLGGLGALGLRPPVAPLEGVNRAARERGRALLRRALARQVSS